MSFALGLTGSIGMGKSTTAQMFADLGCDVWDADAAVHRLYAPGGPAIAPIAALVPDAIVEEHLNRDVLRQAIRADDTLLSKIEAIVHPLVRADREAFRIKSTADILVFDIPLLFETGGDAEMDASVCVWIDETEQKTRVIARGTMSAEDLALILSRQMPINEKKARADYVIHTDTLEHARVQVETIVKDIRERLRNA